MTTGNYVNGLAGRGVMSLLFNSFVDGEVNLMH